MVISDIHSIIYAFDSKLDNNETLSDNGPYILSEKLLRKELEDYFKVTQAYYNNS